MRTLPSFWTQEIIGALPGNCVELHSFMAEDLYGTGDVCLFTGGKEGLFWYGRDGAHRGVISPTGFFHVGLAAADMDGDGVKEVYTAEEDMMTGVFRIVRFKPGARLSDAWTRHVVDAYCPGNPHDIAFFDVDGDGRLEMVAVAAYSKTPGLSIYRFDDIDHPRRYPIMQGHLTEGIRCADLDGDGRIEIISGPDYYHQPEGGCYAGEWERTVFAESFRDMCRMDLVDITGNGKPDIVIVESEYCDGQFSWFENRLGEAENCFIEHRLGECFVFAHSIEAFKENGTVKVMLAEMAEGGWWQPYNNDARILLYETSDGGANWQTRMLYHGQGTHQARLIDIDGDGRRVIASKTWQHPIVHIYRPTAAPDPLTRFKHRFIDRDKEEVATDILPCDLTGGGLTDVVCGKWWYRAPGFEKKDIPFVNQAIAAYDVDGDGRMELVCTLKKPGVLRDAYQALTSELVLMRLTDPDANLWTMESVGTGSGAWPHGIAIGRLEGFGGVVLALAYHDGADGSHVPPEIFEQKAPGAPWERRAIADIHCHEEILIVDIDGDGLKDLVMGEYWLKNNGDRTFTPYKYASGMDICRIRAMDLNGDGRPDIVAVDETCDYQTKTTPFGRLAWFENPADPTGPWTMHTIDALRSAHSLDVADLDGDGKQEIVAAEHIPFKPYRSRSRLMVYRQMDSAGKRFARFMLDDRFEHHDGCKVIELANGRKGIISHGWTDSQFVHLWEMGD